ncbi:MAG: HEAT repeat domain-containing protein [Thermodesulfovibrionales bacterium]
MTDEKKEKLPIDAKLLSDAVIELNISRRSVGLYPREHPIVGESIQRAFGFMQRLFEIRNSITLGIAKDMLMIDEYVLDRKNPVFREFALSLYRRGVVSITFTSGLEIEELIGFHDLLLTGDEVIGQAVLKAAEERNLRHITLLPLDISRLKFTEDGERQGEIAPDIWGNYIKALLDGNLADSDAEGIAIYIPPDKFAAFLNQQAEKGLSDGATYDKVITAYLKRKEYGGVKTELFSRFLELVKGLNPEIKQQILKRAFNNPFLDGGDIDHLVAGLSAADVEKLLAIFNENKSFLPDSLRNIVDKLGTPATTAPVFEVLSEDRSRVDDIEIDAQAIRLLSEDHSRAFVSEKYQDDLASMLRGEFNKAARPGSDISQACTEAALFNRYADLVIEMLGAEETTREDYLVLLTKITEIVNDLLGAGRFCEISDIYNAVYSDGLSGRYREEARGMLDDYFHSSLFIDSFVESLIIWGRYDREGVQRIVKVQRSHLVDPLLSVLADAKDPSIRKFLLQILSSLGSDIVPSATVRLGDDRWYVVRNMLYLIREAGSVNDVGQVKRFARHSNKKVCIEAIRTLIHLNARDAILYLKLYMEGDDIEMRNQVVRLAGTHRFRSIVPTLLKLLDRQQFLGGDIEFKTLIVRALGEIGDPAALKILESIVRATPLFNRSGSEALKQEIFRSLQNYPAGSATTLLKLGLASKNEQIRAISEGLLRGTAD